MATMLHQYGTTTRRQTSIDLRSPFRAALEAIMRAAEAVNGTEVQPETAVEDQANERQTANVHAYVAGERYHFIA